MKLSYYVIVFGVLFIIAGCAAQAPQPAAPVAPPMDRMVNEESEKTAGEEPVEKPAVEEVMTKEAAPEKAASVGTKSIETNKIRLIAADGYVVLENKAVEVPAGSSVLFEYAGSERGKTVVTIVNEAGKVLPSKEGKQWSSGYLTSDRTEWATPAFESPGVYKMKLTFGKADEGTITVK